MAGFNIDLALPLDGRSKGDVPMALTLTGPPRFIDGRAAVMDARLGFLTTTPNADFVPEIVQGIVDVTLRSDGKYGAVDPIQWPQIFAPRYGYLAAVPKRVDNGHKWAAIWRRPSREDFIPLSGTPISGFGVLSAVFIAPLRALVEEMCGRIDEYVRSRNPAHVQDVRWHELAMRHTLHRLSLMSAAFPDQTLQVAELQRHWLMAAGYLEYQRRVRLLPNIAGFTCADMTLMGAWTSNPPTVQTLFDAQIPVWFVRQRHLLHADIRIQLKTSSAAPIMLCSDRFPGVETPIFHGLVGESHLASMMQGGHGYLDISRVPSAAVYDQEEYRSVMSIREAKARSRSGKSASSSNETQGGRVQAPAWARPKPYEKAGSSTPHPSHTRGRDKFQEFTHRWMPPPIPSWSEALAAVDRSAPARASDELWGYWIPEPALVLGPKDDERQSRYLMNWVRARPIWLYLLHVPETRACRVPPQFWRSFLNGVPDDPTSTTRNGRRLIEIKNVFGDVFREEDVDPATDAAVTWHGRHFQSVPDALAAAVIWEMFELGFRYELLALDRFLRPPECASRPEEARREDLLGKIFPGDWLRAVDALPSPDCNSLFAPLPHRRIHALNTLHTVLTRWPKFPSRIAKSPPLQSNDSAETIIGLERELAGFYVDMFFLSSGRAPLVPHLYPG
ncbi:hypothetical protein LXA43DRAFT_666034 [Ganoderma leucocontextum]|nr:hypothetical protein LXA43DRAFT_666034 [Ganoderma leucocontextum]